MQKLGQSLDFNIFRTLKAMGWMEWTRVQKQSGFILKGHKSN